MDRITPHLWFDKEAVEAAEFYSATFPDSSITDVTTLFDTPSGDTDVVSFELFGQPFMAISAGPLFTFNESISFMIRCETQDEIDRYWNALTRGGGEEGRCGWLRDAWGVSWQIVPRDMAALLGGPDAGAAGRAMQAMLGMRKIDIEALQRAREGGATS